MGGCPGWRMALAHPSAIGDPPLPCSLCGEELLTGCQDAGSITLGQYLRQLARHRNFLWFVGMDLVQVWEYLPSSTARMCLTLGNRLLKSWESSCGPRVRTSG